MPTIQHIQIGSALEAELAAKNKVIENIQEEIDRISSERNTIKEKWENLINLENKNITIILNKENLHLNELKKIIEQFNIKANLIYSDEA